MEECGKKRGRALLLWLLTLCVSVSAVVGLWLYGSRLPLLPAQREAGVPAATPLSLWTETEDYKAEPPATDVPAEEYDYQEILSNEDGILIARIEGKRWKGVLAVVDDPTRLFVGSIPYFSNEGYGMHLNAIMERHGAVLGINGGGFDDTVGQGRGGAPIGLVIADGTLWLGGEWGSYDVCAFDEAGKLYVGRWIARDLLEAGVHSAVSFGPALVIDGKIQEFNTVNWEPRSAVGQRADGKVLLMALEGRAVSAQGADMQTLAEVMLQYGAVNATNLDGGASSSLLYKGELMHTCNAVAGLRLVPNGVLVRESDWEEGQDED